MPTATLTSKGQITIPSLVRKRLKLESLQGILGRPGKRAVTLRAMDQGVEKAVRARWRPPSNER